MISSCLIIKKKILHACWYYKKIICKNLLHTDLKENCSECDWVRWLIHSAKAVVFEYFQTLWYISFEIAVVPECSWAL